MPIQTLDDLFQPMLKHVLHAERKTLKVLPKMVRRALYPTLKAAFVQRREGPDGQLAKLEDVFAALGKTARGARCDAMVGLPDEGDTRMGEVIDIETMYAALIARGQAVEHSEIARHGR